MASSGLEGQASTGRASETEEVLIGENDETIELPSNLVNSDDFLTGVLSLSTWNSLSTQTQQNLVKLLPTFEQNDQREKLKTLKMLLSGNPMRFGVSPVQEFKAKMTSGKFSPEHVRMKRLLRKIQRRLDKKTMEQRELRLMSELVSSLHSQQRRHLTSNSGSTNGGSLANGAGQQEGQDQMNFAPSTPGKISNKLEMKIAARYLRELKMIRREAGDPDEDGVGEKDPNLPHGLPAKVPAVDKKAVQKAYNDLIKAHNGGPIRCYPQNGSDQQPPPPPPAAPSNNLNSLNSVNKSRQASDRPTTNSHHSSHHLKSLLINNRPTTSHDKPTTPRSNSQTASQLPQQQQQPQPRTSLLKPKQTPEIAHPMAVEPPQVAAVNITGKSNTVIVESAAPPVKSVTEDAVANIPMTVNVVEDAVANIPGMDVVEEAVANVPLDFPSQQSQKQTSFFAILRDKFRSYPGYCVRIPILREELRAWEDHNAALAATGGAFAVAGITPGGAESMAGESMVSAVAFLLGAFPPECRPLEFVPLLECAPATGNYTWIGSGRDSDIELATLTDLWKSVKHLVRSGFNLPGFDANSGLLQPEAGDKTGSAGAEGGSAAGGGGSAARQAPTPPPAVLKPRDFHSQEHERMSSPLKPYTYVLADHPAPISVGPVRINHSSSASNKVKPHPLLFSTRPAFVTFIVLVQDALARLPNGVGTKTDICMLVKDSQYVNQDAVVENWNALTAVVSGALDRLQGEYDPPCKYMSDKKMWRYLHMGRSEDEFMRKHNEKMCGHKIPEAKTKKGGRKGSKQQLLAEAEAVDLPSQEELMQSAVASILGDVTGGGAPDGRVRTTV